MAKKLCQDGKVALNRQLAKASALVTVGDLLELRYHRRRRVLKVLEIPRKQISKRMAITLYHIVNDEQLIDTTIIDGW